MNNSTKFTALLSSVLLLGALATPVSAAEPVLQRDVRVEPLSMSNAQTITTDQDVPISFERASVTSYHVETPTAPVEVPALQPAQLTETLPSQTIQPLSASVVPVTPQQSTSPEPAPSRGNTGLAGAALAQLGVAQDCTAMVENALRSIGIPVGDLAPAQFAQFGTPVSDIQAGDILIYPGHVSIAISPTEAVHGGLNGMNTGVAGVDVPSAPYQIIRL